MSVSLSRLALLCLALGLWAGCSTGEPDAQSATEQQEPATAMPELDPAAAPTAEAPDKCKAIPDDAQRFECYDRLADDSDAPASESAEEFTPPANIFRCGAETCGLDSYCEERYKGHSVDEKWRPLHQNKCMPLPAACRSAPTCTCLKKASRRAEIGSFKHCIDRGGHLHVDDYPR